MPLFNPKTIQNAVAAHAWRPTPDQTAAAQEWAAMAIDPGIDLKNESQLEQEFNHVVLQRVLGYAVSRPGAPGTMEAKQGIPGGTIVDVALGHFAPSEIGRAHV